MTLWILQALLCLGFLIAGVMKLASDPMQVENFELIGLGQGFRYVTGVLEIVGAVLILIPRFAWLAASLFACIMVGAIVAHLTRLGIDPGLAAPPILLVLAIIVARGRRPRTS
jgi:uncharacterized membrane protein YphA (DoxX/SURF4 family)